MVGTSGYGYLYGDPELLLTTWDYDGNGCGYSEKTVDYPYLYFPTINYTAAMQAEGDDTQSDAAGAARDKIVAVLKYSMCVSECPKASGSVSCYQPQFVFDQSDYYDGCVFYIGGVDYGIAFRYATTLAAGKFCVPDLDGLSPDMLTIITEF